MDREQLVIGVLSGVSIRGAVSALRARRSGKRPCDRPPRQDGFSVRENSPGYSSPESCHRVAWVLSGNERLEATLSRNQRLIATPDHYPPQF